MLLVWNTGRGTLIPGILGCNLPALMLVDYCRRQLSCHLHIEFPIQNLGADVGRQTGVVDDDIQVLASHSSTASAPLRRGRIVLEGKKYSNYVELDGGVHAAQFLRSATVMERGTCCCVQMTPIVEEELLLDMDFRDWVIWW